MNISNQLFAGLAAALLLGVSLHQCHLCRQANQPVNPQPAPITPPAPSANLASPEMEMPRVAAPTPEAPTLLDPYESPAIREQMLDEQVRRMQEYALEAGPDDPFSKTPEQIEEFRKRGNPIVW